MIDSPWPDEDRSAACFTFDLDADEIWNLRIEGDEAWDTPPVKTRGNFGPEVAVPRILELFERYDLPCTFFIPGKVAEDWLETVQAIHEAGHEVGHGRVGERVTCPPRTSTRKRRSGLRTRRSRGIAFPLR